MSDSKSLSEIFQNRLIRIPDYQRGYAWEDKELKYFWEDLFQLADKKVHYTGVITLEPVDQPRYKRWDDDLWLIEERDYKPFYVVDGQQRLMTAMILIQTIMEIVGKDAKLNSQTIEEIRRQYVMVKGADGQRSFLFGYEKDDPSDKFLRTNIFMEHSASNNNKQTFYTRNLADAKTFFAKKLKGLEPENIAKIFKKITQRFKFTLYKIDEEFDVFVTFETMNNRGKELSNLELLKNRLIYLSTLFHENEGHNDLRSTINESWKTIYEYLGKNPDAPLLDDDDFLRNHWRMYFEYSGRKDNEYKVFLLDEKFTAKNVTHPTDKEQCVTIEEIEEYVISLQKAIKPWFYMHNPDYMPPDYMPLAGDDYDQNKMLLDRLGRLSFRSFKPLILAAYCSDQPSFCEINKLLAAAERVSFTLFSLSQRPSHTGKNKFFKAATLLRDGKDIGEVAESVKGWVKEYYSAAKFEGHIEDLYRDRRDDRDGLGFYAWEELPYFLYEYENYLSKIGKQSTEKIDCKKPNAAKKDTVEHIYPQIKNADWAAAFSGHRGKKKRFLTHSLGNLLLLPRAKNSTLKNYSFDLKKNNGKGVGYYNGSFSEKEVAQYDKWTSEEILKRGLKLLKFMEKRWDIKLGGEAAKTRILGLEFLQNGTESSEQ